MPATAFTTPHWRPVKQWPYWDIPASLRGYLVDKGSLTQRLITASDNQFAVQIIRQQLALPSPTEARALRIPAKRRALVREVLLVGRGQPWVFARSIIPLSTMTGRLRTLRHLDNRPLGALLFADPTMKRGPMEIGRIPAQQIPGAIAGTEPWLWGRRSLFYLDGKPLLVSEIFLPGFRP